MMLVRQLAMQNQALSSECGGASNKESTKRNDG
jgi:hypothetical protein